MPRVAVIGAAGYVGLELIRQLKAHEHEIIAVTRANGRFLLQQYDVPVVLPSEVKTAATADVVINLAYPNAGSIYEYSKRNREILENIQTLSGKDGRVIHVSTQAVFGYSLEYTIVAGPLKKRRDYLYIESKLELENLLLKAFGNRDLHIIRLGNIWGPASPTWTAEIARRLVFGEPVGVVGVDGYSNLTDVANAASYIRFLVTSDSNTMTFHHLAEFSDTKWSFWIGKMAAMLGATPVLESQVTPFAYSLGQEIRSLIRNASPATVYQKMILGRFTGSLLRSIVGLMPPQMLAALKRQRKPLLATGHMVSAADETFLNIIACQKRFQSIVDSRWRPLRTVEDSWKVVKAWMESAGFVD